MFKAIQIDVITESNFKLTNEINWKYLVFNKQNY